MNEPTMESVLRRLHRMERDNRRWKWLVTVTLAMIAAAVTLTQVFPRTVLEARKFVLRDADGKSRAELGLMEDGTSILVLNDENGSPGVAVSVLPDGPRRVSLLDTDGKTRSVLTARADGDSGLRLFDKNRIHRASLDVDADGKPILRLSPEDQQTSKKPALPKKRPLLMISDTVEATDDSDLPSL